MFKQKCKLSSISVAAVYVLQMLFASNVHAEKYYKIKDGQLERPEGYREWVFVGATCYA